MPSRFCKKMSILLNVLGLLFYCLAYQDYHFRCNPVHFKINLKRYSSVYFSSLASTLFISVYFCLFYGLKRSAASSSCVSSLSLKLHGFIVRFCQVWHSFSLERKRQRNVTQSQLNKISTQYPTFNKTSLRLGLPPYHFLRDFFLLTQLWCALNVSPYTGCTEVAEKHFVLSDVKLTCLDGLWVFDCCIQTIWAPSVPITTVWTKVDGFEEVFNSPGTKFVTLLYIVV